MLMKGLNFTNSFRMLYMKMNIAIKDVKQKINTLDNLDLCPLPSQKNTQKNVTRSFPLKSHFLLV
jgi:hypothetical protein